MATRTAKKKTVAKKSPWDKPAPARTRATKLTAATKTKARATAKSAGRRYPNLVDNMTGAKKQKKKAS
jgi:hypothetical protein